MQSAGLSARGFARNSPGGAQCSDWLDEEVTSLKIASFPALWEDKASGLALGLQPPIWAGRCGVCINVTNVSYLGAGLVRMDGPGRLLLASAAGSGGCWLYFPLILCLSSEATKVCKDGTARRNTGFFFFFFIESWESPTTKLAGNVDLPAGETAAQLRWRRAIVDSMQRRLTLPRLQCSTAPNRRARSQRCASIHTRATRCRSGRRAQRQHTASETSLIKNRCPALSLLHSRCQAGTLCLSA